MFRNFFTTKRICRAGVIAALYVALTYAFMPFAYGWFQIRPSEALTILPLFFPEAIPALYIGCILANLTSPMLAFDLTIGPAVTLVAAVCTWLVGHLLRSYRSKLGMAVKIALGGFFPVILNAFIIPVVIVFLSGDMSAGPTPLIAYWTSFGTMLATEATWAFGLGAPLALFVERMRQKGVSAFIDGKRKQLPAPDPSDETPQPQA